nr:insulin induced gene 2 protein [Hymenolepis microstoma]
MIADAQKQVTLAEKRPKIKEILDRRSELGKYMDPNYLDDQAVTTEAKIKVILSHEAEIRQTAQALEALQSLKDVLNNPAYSDLSAMRKKFAEMHQKHAEQEIRANDFIDESNELLEAYANATRSMSKLLLAWQKKVVAK